jgi:hypothetical protein
LLAELAEVLNRPKLQVILARSETDPEQTLGELRRLAEIVESAAAASTGQPRSSRSSILPKPVTRIGG